MSPNLWQVEELANGTKRVDEIGNESFQSWLRGFTFMKIVERPIEGWHARSLRHIRRSPAIKLPALSFELRYENLCRLLLESPEAGLVGRPGQHHIRITLMR